MTFVELKTTLKKDKYRYSFYEGSKKISWIVVWSYRVGHYLYKKTNFLARILAKIWSLYYRLITLCTGIQLPLSVEAGEGLLFPHFSCIVLAGNMRIGKNCTIHQGVTIGRMHFGSRVGLPSIGDNVVIFPGANIAGNIRIGDGAIIGANSVVTSDVPDFSVVAGVPAKVISNDSRKVLGKRGAYIYWAKK